MDELLLFTTQSITFCSYVTLLSLQAAHSLRRIRLLLDEIDWSDRIKFCKADFDAAANVLRKQKQFFSNSLLLEIATISNEYFNLSSFRKLPLVVIQEILLWLPICDLLSVFNVSREWYEVGCSNEIWSTFYKQKFLLNNPPDPKDGLIGKWNINSFKVRLNDPFIGDKVEVAWQGKFRLETQDVYQGLAWWVAEVVDKNTERGKYKIRYPGWESRWDEWVPRHRLRWAVACNNLVSIHVNDIVELWCCGANVPGAWLVSKVKRIRNNRYCIGRVMQSGYVWVERDRIRLVRRAVDVDHGGENSPRPRRRNILQSISSMSHRLEAAQSIASSCSIM